MRIIAFKSKMTIIAFQLKMTIIAIAFFQIKSGNPNIAPILNILVILCTELTIKWDEERKQIGTYLNICEKSPKTMIIF